MLGAAFCLLTGCIREDRSDCSCDVFLDFLYTGDGQTDIFPDKIDKVNMTARPTYSRTRSTR